MKVLILLSFAAVSLAIQECGENSHYNSCGTACPLTCENYKNPPKACVLMCNPGCHCDKGYVKNADGRCVAPEECKALTDPASFSKCRENSHFESCGTACPLTCKNYRNPPKSCNMMCKIGCQCDEGYVKNDNGRCVRPEECLTEQMCEENQFFTKCGTACPLTCDNYQNPPKVCTMQCVLGCQCRKGYVQTRDGKCVRPEECPTTHVKPLNTEVCGENEVYTTCGTACPLTCDNYQNPHQICTLQCVIGCKCENGFVKTNDGKCVRPEECPAKTTEKNCVEEAETGFCRAYFPMWYFDVKSGECKKFIYGGCGGNGNRYGTKKECERQCGVVLNESALDTCELLPETGPCRAMIPRFFFNKATGKCEKFVYGGCQGNSNNFKTSEECEQRCSRAT